MRVSYFLSLFVTDHYYSTILKHLFTKKSAVIYDMWKPPAGILSLLEFRISKLLDWQSWFTLAIP